MTIGVAIKLAGERAGLAQRNVEPPKELVALLDQEMNMQPGMTADDFIDSLSATLLKAKRAGVRWPI